MQCKLGNGNNNFLSLDDLLMSAREGDVSTSKNKDSASVIEKKQARKVASTTDHAKNQCHVRICLISIPFYDCLNVRVLVTL